MPDQLIMTPITLAQANDAIKKWHRHHKPVPGAKLALGVSSNDSLVGVAVLSRPVARLTDYKQVAEVTRVATDGTPNACSKLYGAARRIAKEMGYKMIQTFILEEEPGTSLKAAGWKCVGKTAGGHWACPSRERKDQHPLGKKTKWVAEL